MAGIGFELKKLYKKEGMLAKLKGHFFSIFVTIGPILISVLLIVSLQVILRSIGIKRSEIDLLQATIMYSFIGGVIITSGYSMLLSRYLSDRLYINRKEDMLPALYGSIAVIVTIMGIVGLLFYWNSPLDLVYKMFAYILFVELGLQIVISVFVSAIKDYRKVSYSFVIGTIFGFIVAYSLLSYTNLRDILAVLIALDAGLLLIILLLIYEVKRFFKVKSNLYYAFIGYFENIRLIFLTNMLYISSLYIHNYMFWRYSDLSYTLAETYTYAPLYDVPAAFAFLSLTPTLVMFVVKVETAFFEKYRNLFYLINHNASYDDIKYSKEELLNVTGKELQYMMEIQLFFSIAFIIVGSLFLPNIGFTNRMVALFIVQVLSYYCMIISFVIMTIMLYYDYQVGAVTLAATLFVGVGIFSRISIIFGDVFYGFGFLFGSFTTLVLGLFILNRYLKDLEYRVFCDQVVWMDKAPGRLKRFIAKIEGEE